MTTTERAGRPDRSRSRSAASDTPSSPTIMKMSYLVLRNRPNRQHRSVGGTSCSLPRGRVPPRAPNSPRPHGARRTPGQGVSWAARRRAHCAHGRDTAVVELMSSPPVRALRAVATDPAAAGTSPGPDVAAQPAPAAEGRSHTARLWLAAALGATALGLTLRIVGLADGLPYHFHWDEPTIMNRVIRMGGGDLNPHFFYYPTLLMYLLLAVQGCLYVVGRALHQFPSVAAFAVTYLTDSTLSYMAGRALVAGLGAASVLVTFLVGRRFLSAPAAIVGALLLAVSPVHIGSSHFITNDVPMACFALVAYVFLWDVYSRGRGRDYVLSGVA